MGGLGCAAVAGTSMLPWSTGGMSAKCITGSSEVSHSVKTHLKTNSLPISDRHQNSHGMHVRVCSLSACYTNVSWLCHFGTCQQKMMLSAILASRVFLWWPCQLQFNGILCQCVLMLQVCQLCITMLQEHPVQAGSLFKICLTNDPALLKAKLPRPSQQLLREYSVCLHACIAHRSTTASSTQAVTIYSNCIQIFAVQPMNQVCLHIPSWLKHSTSVCIPSGAETSFVALIQRDCAL